MGVEFDHVVVGAGLSGLLLTRALLARTGPGSEAPTRLLLADPRPRDDRPLTYAFWSDRPSWLHRWSIGSWNTLRVVGRNGKETTVPLGRWRYTAVDWARARADLLDEITDDPRVTFMPESVDRVHDGPRFASIVVGRGAVQGSWVYDSRPPSWAESSHPERRHALPAVAQRFRGVWVRSTMPIDTTAATLLDFSADPGDDLGFAYVLPTSHASALVMAVRMGHDVPRPDPAVAVARLVGEGAWTVVDEESGDTPLLSPQPPRRVGHRVLAIGVRGGRARPSTGYAVRRILTDTEMVRRSLDRHGHPFDIPADPRWQQMLDHVWLRALNREGAGLEPAFVALFTEAPVESTLRFLDGGPRAYDVLAVLRALPPRPFVRALLG